jgi:hypothetical protein
VPVPAPSAEQLARLVRTIAERIGRSLERAGLLTRDLDNAYLALDPSEEAPINTLLGHSITYRIATGPREGQKVFTLQTLPAEPAASRKGVAESAGFSLHAGVRANSRERNKLEHLARYVSRPPIAIKRLALTDRGHVRSTLKRPYSDGTTHVIFEPMDFIARLVALVPKPKAHLTRYHGGFAPNSALRAQVVTRPAADHAAASSATTDAPPRRAMTWAQRLKRVLAIQIDRCGRCGGRLRVIASIDQAPVIERILDHLGCTKGAADLAHASRAPPASDLPF